MEAGVVGRRHRLNAIRIVRLEHRVEEVQQPTTHNAVLHPSRHPFSTAAPLKLSPSLSHGSRWWSGHHQQEASPLSTLALSPSLYLSTSLRVSAPHLHPARLSGHPRCTVLHSLQIRPRCLRLLLLVVLRGVAVRPPVRERRRGAAAPDHHAASLVQPCGQGENRFPIVVSMSFADCRLCCLYQRALIDPLHACVDSWTSTVRQSNLLLLSA